MRIDRLETHDRLEHFKKQSFDIAECCQDIIDKRPYGEHAFYIFAHPRTDDDGVRKRLIWQPRLTKPLAQPNSMLFKVYPKLDQIIVKWILPAEELWKQFNLGNVTEDTMVLASIREYQTNKAEMERPDPDDLTDDEINSIYKSISTAGKTKKLGLILPSAPV